MADLQFLKWAWLLNFANDINVRLGIIIAGSKPDRASFKNINFSPKTNKAVHLLFISCNFAQKLGSIFVPHPLYKIFGIDSI